MLRAFIYALCLFFAGPAFAGPRNIATGPTGFYVDNSGNDANDGLTPATAKQHYCAALNTAFNDWDMRGYTIYVYPTQSQYFNEMCSFGYAGGMHAAIVMPSDPANPQIAGTGMKPAANLIRSCTPPGCGSLTPAVQWCDNVADYSIFIYYGVTFADCNHYGLAGGASLLMHLTAIVDFFGNRSIISGRGAADVGILLDGPGVLTIGPGLEINGQVERVVKCLKTCNLSVSGNMYYQYTNMIAPYYLGQGSHGVIQTSTTIGSSVVFSGPNVVAGNSSVRDSDSTIGGAPGGWVQDNGGRVCDMTGGKHC
jgi:hypothetical protein